jgi:hypothetical protein
MSKKSLMALIIIVLVTGGAFAQTDFASMAKNTFTVDFGPTIAGAAFRILVDKIVDAGLNTSGFGLAGQYERQISKPLSVAGRFAYLQTGLGIMVEESRDGATGRASTDANLTSFSVEGHIRCYPLGDTFFLDGMVGYANLKTDLSGTLKIQYQGRPVLNEDILFTASRDYLKLGAKLGWRISFGKNGGFTFEPAVGYSYGIGLGDTIGAQVSDKYGGEAADIDEMLSYFENLVYIGGPRLSLALGYRF